MGIDQKLLIIDADINAFDINVGVIGIKGFAMEATLLRVSRDFYGCDLGGRFAVIRRVRICRHRLFLVLADFRLWRGWLNQMFKICFEKGALCSLTLSASEMLRDATLIESISVIVSGLDRL